MNKTDKIERIARKYSRIVGMLDELRAKAKLMKANLGKANPIDTSHLITKMREEILTYSNSLEEIRADLEDILNGTDRLQ